MNPRIVSQNFVIKLLAGEVRASAFTGKLKLAQAALISIGSGLITVFALSRLRAKGY